LTILKRYLLPDTLATDRKFDAVLQGIGLGVAGLFDSVCNRKLDYLEGAEAVFTGDREHFTLPRYPVVSVTSVEAIGVAGDLPYTINEGSGLIRFFGTIGSERSQVRVVWTGGYWFEALEPDDEGYPSARPAGATELPNDLQAAFLLQCEQVWQTHDRLGTGLVGDGAGSAFLNTRLSTLELVPLVVTMLNGYRRYQLS